jgi:hypothetical protein
MIPDPDKSRSTEAECLIIIGAYRRGNLEGARKRMRHTCAIVMLTGFLRES